MSSSDSSPELLDSSVESLEEVNTDVIQRRIISYCVNYFLVRSCDRFPIKKLAILQNMRQTVQFSKTKLTNKIIALTNDALKDVYGYEIKDIGSKKNSEYILVLSSDIHPAFIEYFPPEKDTPVILATLAHIIMSCGIADEDGLYKFLKMTGLIVGDNVNIKNTLKLLEKQRYIKCKRVTTFNTESVYYEWGQRALHEVSKMSLIKKVAEAMNVAPDHVYEPYKMILDETKED